MRTHESVLRTNYNVTEEVTTGDNWHSRKFFLDGKDVLDRRLIVVDCKDGSYNIQNQYNALGSFHDSAIVNLTREQIDFIKASL